MNKVLTLEAHMLVNGLDIQHSSEWEDYLEMNAQIHGLTREEYASYYLNTQWAMQCMESIVDLYEGKKVTRKQLDSALGEITTITQDLKATVLLWKDAKENGNGAKEAEHLDTLKKLNVDKKAAERKVEDFIKSLDKNVELNISEAKLSKIHNAAKKGSYPITLVVTEKGKVIKQELVGTSAIVPAAFNQLQQEYPNAKISIESRTGETLFVESEEVTESYMIESPKIFKYEPTELTEELRKEAIENFGNRAGSARVARPDLAGPIRKEIMDFFANNPFDDVADLDWKVSSFDPSQPLELVDLSTGGSKIIQYVTTRIASQYGSLAVEWGLEIKPNFRIEFSSHSVGNSRRAYVKGPRFQKFLKELYLSIPDNAEEDGSNIMNRKGNQRNGFIWNLKSTIPSTFLEGLMSDPITAWWYDYLDHGDHGTSAEAEIRDLFNKINKKYYKEWQKIHRTGLTGVVRNIKAWWTGAREHEELMGGEPLFEAEEVTKEMWDKEWNIKKAYGKDFDKKFKKRIEAAMSKAKDEDQAEEWAYKNFKQLPDPAKGMTIEESVEFQFEHLKTLESFVNESSDYDKKMDRKYGRNREYSNIDVQDIHFQMDPAEFEDMMNALGKKFGGITTREKQEDAEYELKRFRKEIKYWDGNKRDQEWAVSPFAGPEHYNTVKSTLGAGPHSKGIKAPKWNQRKYDKWIETMAYDNDGLGQDSSYGFEMAQNATHEPGLIDWVKKNFRGTDPLQRIQWDIEAQM
jgi:hypothetical protein